MLLLLDRDTQRVYRLHDFTKTHHLVPGQAYCVAGKVNSADKLYLVIESVRPDTKHARSSTTPVPADGAEQNPLASELPRTRPTRYPHGTHESLPPLLSAQASKITPPAAHQTGRSDDL